MFGAVRYLVAAVLRLERALDVRADIVGLLTGQLGQVWTQLGQLLSRYVFAETLRYSIILVVVLVTALRQLDLS